MRSSARSARAAWARSIAPRDPRLRTRQVAIKVLPASFSQDPDRLRRFEQEARAAAALNHPNILAVHDVGRTSGISLPRIRAARGPDAARAICRTRRRHVRASRTCRVRLRIGAAASVGQCTRVCRCAGRSNTPSRSRTVSRRRTSKHVVHRDLKPENIFVTARRPSEDSRLRAGEAHRGGRGESTTELPPTTPDLNTQAGVILGTIGYMAPEQVRGRPVDHRADIFAFGVILYEMLAGQRAFQGDDVGRRDQRDLKERCLPILPIAERHIPPALERIVDGPREGSGRRFQTATDLAFALECTLVALAIARTQSSRAAVVPLPGPALASRGSPRLPRLALLGTRSVTVRHLREIPPAARPVRFLIDVSARHCPSRCSARWPSLPTDNTSSSAPSRTVCTMLWVRPLARLAGAGAPGHRWGVVSLLVTRQPMRLASLPREADEGSAQRGSGRPRCVMRQQDAAVSGSSADNTIVFAPSAPPGLQKVSSAGGTAVPLTTLARGRAVTMAVVPPDHRHFLYVTVVSGIGRPTGAHCGSGRSIRLNDRRSGAVGFRLVYSSGHLLFVRGSTLWRSRSTPIVGRRSGTRFRLADRAGRRDRQHAQGAHFRSPPRALWDTVWRD